MVATFEGEVVSVMKYKDKIYSKIHISDPRYTMSDSEQTIVIEGLRNIGDIAHITIEVAGR